MSRTPIPPADAAPADFGRPGAGWRLRLYTVIFEADTRAGRAFDIVLIWAILVSVAIVVLDSVASIGARFETAFEWAEWGFTVLFTAEYLARLACVRRPGRYATSVFGIIDLLAVLPTWLALLAPEPCCPLGWRCSRPSCTR
ncbi:ion transporter [Piscinibacter defluvii]|uniref:ion transporter n=1 Tax=Piscinibacter defluvii TaxID=1796922 RepID=UPI002872ACB0|nr:ion transporter [Piscinibacter defluvii]